MIDYWSRNLSDKRLSRCPAGTISRSQETWTQNLARPKLPYVWKLYVIIIISFIIFKILDWKISFLKRLADLLCIMVLHYQCSLVSWWVGHYQIEHFLHHQYVLWFDFCFCHVRNFLYHKAAWSKFMVNQVLLTPSKTRTEVVSKKTQERHFKKISRHLRSLTYPDRHLTQSMEALLSMNILHAASR